MTRNHNPISIRSDWAHFQASSTVNRRRLLSYAAAVSATAGAVHLGITGRTVAARKQDTSVSPAIHTWLLSSPDVLRPEAPTQPTPAEAEELIGLQESRTDGMNEAVTRWSGAQVTLPWDALGMEVTTAVYPPGLFEVRSLAHLRAAMHDALVAALDAQSAYPREAPSIIDDRIVPIGAPSTASSTFPSEHAAVAGAASTVLAYLFPDASEDGFAALAEEAALSRLWAGTNFRSDIEAGLELGRAVGQVAIEHALADGSDAVWDSSDWPTGDGLYVPTPPNFVDQPLAPLAGTWASWVLPSGDAIRPAPFPAYGSVGWEAELQTVRELTEQRTLEQERIIDFWLSKGPHGYYSEYAKSMIERENLNDVEAANLLASVAISIYDALVAVWDAKYHYWIARPITADPELDLYIPNPPYPSYPGGFGAAAAAAATVLAHAFPQAESDLLHSCWEAGAQRAWCGIHYALDDDVALVMGSQVGRMVAETPHMSNT
jgi:membrane-associated phospholipid phosphatase